jgi:signal transduction histidine kinase/ligand-binding sensor domain-containing protein
VNMSFRKNFQKGAILILLVFFSVTLFATEVLYNRKYQAGLMLLNISNIVKDQKGYMWFGTIKGLNRWDGYKYKYFLTDKNDSTSISSNKIQALIIDKEQLMWAGTPNGLNCFNPVTESFTHFFHNSNDPGSISSDNVTTIQEDPDGNLWVGTDNGINVYNKKTKTFRFIDVSKLINIPAENYSFIRFLHCDSEGIIWIGFNVSGVLKLNSKNLESRFFLKDDFNNYISSVNDMVEIDKNTLLMATWGSKAFTFSKISNSFAPWKGNKLVKSNVIDFLGIDKMGNIWISDHYLQILNISSDLKIIKSYSTNSEFNKIPSDQISAIYLENENIWFGTYNQGFFQIRNSRKIINNLSSKSPKLNQLGNIQVTAITAGRTGEIFIGTSNRELFIYNEITNSLQKVAVSQDIVTRLYFDPYHERLFLGQYSSYLSYIDLKTLKEIILVRYPSAYANYNFAGNKDKLFVALWSKGIYEVNSDGKMDILGKNNWEKSFSTLSMTLVDTLLWIATNENGILSYNTNTRKFKSYPLKGETTTLFPTNQVNLIKPLKNGKLLVSSNELGLCYFDERTDSCTKVGINNEINNVQVKAIIEDNKNNIWIISEQKIIKTNEAFDTQSAYTLYDGLNFGIEHLAAIFNPVSENIYIGGQEGIQFLNTNDLVVDTTSNNVVITDFKVFEKSAPRNSKILNGRSISYTDSIILSYKENFISIDFSSMNYSDQNESLYSYKLQGVNSEWITVPFTQNSITYSNLSPGEYIFLIKASNRHGTWSEVSTHLHISITPPFWRTSWFRFIVIALIIAIVWGYIKLREFNYLKEKRKLETIVFERTAEILVKNEKLEIQTEELIKANDVKNKFFNIIAHDLKNPVGSIVQLIELAKENFDVFTREQQLEIINSTANSANSTLELLEDLLLWARSQTDKITYQFEKLNINDLAKSEINNLFQQAINKQITIKNNLLQNVCILADTSSVKTIFRNLLSNAIKFSKKGGTIKIGCHIKENDLLIYIKDNGIGMSESTLQKLFVLSEKQSIEGTSGEKGSGLGLNLCQEFILKNGGKIWAESELNVGSTFFFTLPLCLNTI